MFEPDPDALKQAWEAALALWEVRVDLSPPEPLARAGAQDWGGNEPLAYIDMVRRQVVVNYPLLGEIGAASSLVAVFAHEIGHHVAFPHTLGLSAQLQLLEQRLIPGLGQSLTNLFFDLQVNEVVGRTQAAELAAVYRGFVAKDPAVTPLFWFYLAVYEELWGLPAGELAPGAQAAEMEERYPGVRASARMFAQTFWALADVFLQFLYFCSAFIRYLPPKADQTQYKIPLGADVPEPELDDWAGGLYGSDAVERALEEAVGRGWIADKGTGSGEDPLATIGKVFGGGAPGKARQKFREALVARHYKRLVDQHLLRIPPADEKIPDPFLPTTLSEWEFGDNLRSIDWTASILNAGELAPLRALRRDLEPEPPTSAPGESLYVEIYLDTSGSMPDPGVALNAMTLAAQILAASAIRNRGKVRAIIYSSDYLLSEWMYDENVARRYLLQYSGGGTTYPWKLLKKLHEERPDVIRVIISDGDFLANVTEKGAKEVLAGCLAGARRRFVTLLNLHDGLLAAMKERLGAHPTLRVVRVSDMSQFAKMATDLATRSSTKMFELKKIQQEIAAAPLASPYSIALSMAVISDVLRSGTATPPTVASWKDLLAAKPDLKTDLREEQLGMLAHFLTTSTLRAQSAVAIEKASPLVAPAHLEEFLRTIFPLTAEMIRANTFRQEEFLRRWIACWRGVVVGEQPEQSQKRLEQLDYRLTLVEYQKAEKARAAEAQIRAEALRKAAEEADAAARGWRE